MCFPIYVSVCVVYFMYDLLVNCLLNVFAICVAEPSVLFPSYARFVCLCEGYDFKVLTLRSRDRMRLVL